MLGRAPRIQGPRAGTTAIVPSHRLVTLLHAREEAQEKKGEMKDTPDAGTEGASSTS